MLNIDYSTIEIACPKCQFITPVSIRQIRLRDVVIWPNSNVRVTRGKVALESENEAPLSF